ncbi:hypothetical protein [Streptomyces sp. NPDC013457]|uniref:hypothetical protein n=1 Tax=Streptomyces sp. NPDC013457 TaxID=3364866 RepID=UPI0037012879
MPERVPQSLRPHSLPLRRPLPLDHPGGHRTAGEKNQREGNPRVGGQEIDQTGEQHPRGEQTAADEGELLASGCFV